MITRVKRRLQRFLGGMVGALCPGTFAQDLLYHGTLIRRFAGRLVIPYDLNDSGEIAGRVESPLRAILADPAQGTARDLGTLPGSDVAFAYGINNLE